MHGGDIYRNLVKIDFSINVNPLGVPKEVMQAMINSMQQVDCYPDMTCGQLKKDIADSFGTIPERVLCGNGASELIMAICRWKMPRKALLLGPGFSGYTRALKAVGCEIQMHELQEVKGFVPGEELLTDIETYKPEIFFLANPSNPTGVLLERSYIERLLMACKKANTLFVLDECFMELTGKADASSMSFEKYLKQYDKLLILRAFTKSFAIPGIRLGYLLCGNAGYGEAIEKQLPEWNVSTPAQAAGSAALLCNDYLMDSIACIKEERTYLETKMKEMGAKIFPSQANFILFKWEEQIYDELLKREILIRDCSDYIGLGKGYFRIAVRKREENDILLNAFSELMQKHES